MEQSEFEGAGGGVYNFGKAESFCELLQSQTVHFFLKGEKKGYNKRSKSFV